MFIDDSSSDHLRVEKGQGLTLTVKAGRANINGAFYWQKDDETITLEKNNATKSYNIILRLNDNDAYRNITLIASDINNGITRSGSIYDLVLATVTVTGNANEVKGSDITDTRLDSTRCGVVTSTIKNVQSLDLFTQVTELFKEIKAQNKSEMNANRIEFNEWFETVKDTLDTDTAGKLSNRISSVEKMIMDNHFTTILLAEDGTLVDENGQDILADWEYEVDGGEKEDKCYSSESGYVTGNLANQVAQNAISAQTSAVNAKASEAKAKEYADNLQNSTETISQLKEDVINHSDKVNFITGAHQYSNGFKIGAPQKGGTFDSSITNRCYTIIEDNIKNFYINVNKMYQYNVIVANKVDDKYNVVYNSNAWSQGENFYYDLISKHKGNSLIVLFRNKNDLEINTVILNEIKNSIILNLDNSVYADRNKRIVDVFMFMGQSNMAGRGITNAEHPEKAPTIMSGAGYEYRAISDDTKLSNIEEPFGKNENVSGAIDDGQDKTGSMVTSFVNAYYANNGNIPVIAVSASQGGTLSSQWVANSAKLNDAINRLNKTIEFLNKNGYSIRHKYMVWCQGESDADSNYSKDTWTTNFKSMLTAMLSAGIEKCFMVRIGNCNIEGSEDRYKNMISWQTEMARTDRNVVMASCDFAGMKKRGLMKDQFHYFQEGYNECGTYAGINVAHYVTTGKEPTMYDTEDGSLYYSHKN